MKYLATGMKPQVDVGGEHALRVVLHLGDDLPRGADDPREPVTVGHRLAAARRSGRASPPSPASRFGWRTR